MYGNVSEQCPWYSNVRTFFLFALMCIPYLLIMWKLVPETTGKSLEEIERYCRDAATD